MDSNYGNAAVMLGKGDGTFGAPTDYRVQFASINVAHGIADFDGDNLQDLAVNDNWRSYSASGYAFGPL